MGDPIANQPATKPVTEPASFEVCYDRSNLEYGPSAPQEMCLKVHKRLSASVPNASSYIPDGLAGNGLGNLIIDVPSDKTASSARRFNLGVYLVKHPNEQAESSDWQIVDVLNDLQTRYDLGAVQEVKIAMTIEAQRSLLVGQMIYIDNN